MVDTENKFQEYFKKIRNKYLTQDYTETTLRTPFENFITSLNKNFELIHEPKRKQKLGAPDFKAFNKSVKIGYIETKDLVKKLDNELDSEQIIKYKESINNIIITNYGRFILIRNNQKIFDLSLFRLSDLKKSKYIIPSNKIEEFLKLTETFFDYKICTITSAKELAKELSKKAELLKDLAKEQLEEDLTKVKNNEETSSIFDFYEGLKELIKDVSIDDCADAYAQTITYGLFLAKINSTGDLDKNSAASYIPRSISVIKRIFINIAGDSLPSNLSWIIDEIIDILNASDIKKILSELDFRGKKDRDPFTFFYEDFLSRYDPEKRKHLGVFYTPRPVVSFIVNSVNQILKKDFKKLKGFADDDVTVLDPAVGTGTFLWLAFILTLVELKNKGLGGLIKKKIENHLLKDFYGLEILITPYIISHLKLTMVLKKWFYELKDNDRIQTYLTNTLDPSEKHSLIPFLKEITKESEIANKIKITKPILVIIGNPPYSVSSSNKSEWIMERMKDYKKDLDERNIQPLDDDYIKFIRFAQWKIEQNQQGVIGFITNNSYLDGLIHRQMRKELINTFDRTYILNLHGSSRKEEKLPSNILKDENVFDIQQGVSIGLFIKNSKFKDKKVFYADLYGRRHNKYSYLDKNKVDTVKWLELKPKEPYYFFIKKEKVSEKAKVLYENSLKLTSIFKKYSIGVVSGDDKTRVSFNKDGKHIYPYDYRPFDKRYIDLYDKSIQRPRLPFMDNFKKENVGLVCSKQSKGSFNHSFITKIFACKQFISDASYIFPLYIYYGNGKKFQQKTLTNENLEPKSGKHANFTKDFIKFIEKQYPNCEITPEEILGYIYAILHSPTYRQKFSEFLRIDFPRIPFIKDFNSFKQLSKLGNKLIQLHLMKEKLKSKVGFDIGDSNIVEFVKYNNKRIYINKKQYFDNVSEDVWNFFIGSYQVLNKWLKNRKNRELCSGEIEELIQINEIIKQTIEYMKEIDNIKIL